MTTIKTTKRTILITNALTYANYSLHLGHIVGYIATDIWARFQKMRGHECYFVGGSDCHGTAIMLSAEKEGLAPEDFVVKIKKEQQQDSHDFLIDFDNFHTTHSKENYELVTCIFELLKQKGDILPRVIDQAFDPVKNIFLPDRYVKGTCPKCHTKDQYGDSCENCGATYSPMDLIDPISALSGVKPITKSSEHYFFNLPRYSEALKHWGHDAKLQGQVINKLNEWFEQGLQTWDISRDAPYFGFEIPGIPGKYFYVWLDAPIGYIASFKDYCNRHPSIDFGSFWNKDSATELYHVIGKDIMYFHSLFWPAILMSAGFRTPTTLFIHGFLTINGQKMSKSRGTFITARAYLDNLAPEYMRYYMAAKMTRQIEDIDLNLDDFRAKINSDLVGKIINIASRCAKFINNNFGNVVLPPKDNEMHLIKRFTDISTIIADAYENHETAKVVREVMALADIANQYIDEHKPWKLIKEKGQEQRVHEVCSMGIQMFRWLILYLKPVLPELAKKTEQFLEIPPLTWNDSLTPLAQKTIAEFKPMMQRIEQSQIDAILKNTKENSI